MKNGVYLYPVWVRLWHLVNALLCLLLICTGLCLQYSGNRASIISFSDAVIIHNVAGIALLISYFLFLIGNRFTSNGAYYQFHKKGFLSRVFKQFKYYSIGIFKKEKAPFPISIERKFNPLQKLSYVVVMYFFMPVVLLTGVALFFPDMLPANIVGVNGLHLTDLIHIIVGFGLSIFMVVHIYFCTIGKTPLANFKSMINGWH